MNKINSKCRIEYDEQNFLKLLIVYNFWYPEVFEVADYGSIDKLSKIKMSYSIWRSKFKKIVVLL